jgi:hypothetical protein
MHRHLAQRLDFGTYQPTLDACLLATIGQPAKNTLTTIGD